MREAEGDRRSPGLYRKIEVRMWGDEKFCRLSAIPPCGQGLWFYLLTGPHTGPIPGLFKAGRAGMAEELGWTLEAFDEAFAEVFAQGMVKADFKARLVWLPNAVKINSPASPNVVTSWRSHFDLLPECSLKEEALEGLRASVFKVGEAYGKAFDKAFGKPSTNPLPKPCPNQEQDKEQEKKEKEDVAPPPVGGVAAPAPTPPKKPSRRSSSDNGGSKPPPGGGIVAEVVAEILADPGKTDEDRFFALRPALEAKGVAWSRAMQLQKLCEGEGFGPVVAALAKTLKARDPSSYLGGIVSDRRRLINIEKPAAAKARNGHAVPDWVRLWREEGHEVRPEGPNRWRSQGRIFDDDENEVGW